MHITRRAFVSSSSVLTTSLAFGPARAALNERRTARLRRAMHHGRFVSYQPTAIRAVNGKLSDADDQSIAEDLVALRPWFDGLITYSAANGAERVPDIASKLGYRAVVLGIFDIGSAAEIESALAAIRRNRQIVVGCVVGNETILAGRGNWRDVSVAIAKVRAETDVAVSTTEPFAQYLDQKESALALSNMDFMTVNIHPIFEPWFRSGTPANWTEFVSTVCDRLAARYRGPILVKETGVPSGPTASGFNETMQHDFWRSLEKRMPAVPSRAFSYFTAFDSPWRAFDATPVSGPRPEEAHWGLFTEARAPKIVMTDLPRLS